METYIEGKSWYQSKTFWYNTFVMVVEALALLTDKVQDPQALAFIIFLHGFGNIVLRVWFTAAPIGSTPVRITQTVE